METIHKNILKKVWRNINQGKIGNMTCLIEQFLITKEEMEYLNSLNFDKTGRPGV